jgi:hypothetical protein
VDGDGPWISFQTGEHTDGPQLGDKNAVLDVRLIEGRQFLEFGKWPGRTFTAVSFDKLRGENIEACDEDFLKLVKHKRATERQPETVDA